MLVTYHAFILLKLKDAFGDIPTIHRQCEYENLRPREYKFVLISCNQEVHLREFTHEVVNAIWLNGYRIDKPTEKQCLVEI